MGFENGGFCNIRQRTGIQIPVGFRIDEVKHLQVIQMQCCLSPQQCRKVIVIKSAVTHIDAAEGAPDKVRAHGSCQLNGGLAIGDAVHAKGHADFILQPSYHIGHGCRGDEVHMPLVGQTEFIGDEDAIHTAVLQRPQILQGMLYHSLHRITIMPPGITGQRVQVQHGDDGLFDMEHRFGPKHGIAPFL